MKNTKLILLHDVDNLGASGDVVTVKAGYARHFLVPRKLAQPWSENAQRQIDAMARAARRRAIASVEDARAVRDRLEASDGIRLDKRVGEGNRLYGAVSQREIATAVKDQLGQTVDYRKVRIASPIKSLGNHSVRIILHEDVDVSIPVAIYAQK